MPSSKKARGRARRAAKEAKAAEDAEETEVEANHQDGSLEAQMQRLTINNLLRESDAVQKCRHGFELEGNELRLCIEFVQVFTDGVFAFLRAGGTNLESGLVAGMEATEKKFSEVWHDVSLLKHAASNLVAGAVQGILDGKNDKLAKMGSSFACYFEQYVALTTAIEMNNKTQLMIDGLRIGELQWADMNTVVSYLRKRIPCKCLDKKYKEVKSIIKMGLCANPECSHPDRRVERKTMYCCTGCSDTYYCSAECQKAHWSDHKKECRAKLRRG
jgi:hypothetical protein